MKLYRINIWEAAHNSAIFAKNFFGPVAQWIEQQPSKLWVERSNRSGVTIFPLFLPPLSFLFLMQVDIEPSWKNVLQTEFKKEYFGNLADFLKTEIAAGKTIYPKGSNIFNAFKETPFEKVKVVIIGQDPYHNPEQAHGLCFSVPSGITLPPSLKNIFKELKSDIGLKEPSSGDLTAWARQGVLLLNSSLTVRKNEPTSHSKIGWERFTNRIIELISEKREGIIFLLWGTYARSKQIFIDPKKHFILTAAHPSPLSAHNGFFGCRHFSQTNELLIKQGKSPIDWKLK